MHATSLRGSRRSTRRARKVVGGKDEDCGREEWGMIVMSENNEALSIDTGFERAIDTRWRW